MDTTIMYLAYSNSLILRTRICIEEDYLFYKNIELMPVASPSYDSSLIRVISNIKNKYIFYYVMFF